MLNFIVSCNTLTLRTILWGKLCFLWVPKGLCVAGAAGGRKLYRDTNENEGCERNALSLLLSLSTPLTLPLSSAVLASLPFYTTSISLFTRFPHKVIWSTLSALQSHESKDTERNIVQTLLPHPHYSLCHPQHPYPHLFLALSLTLTPLPPTTLLAHSLYLLFLPPSFWNN